MVSLDDEFCGLHGMGVCVMVLDTVARAGQRCAAARQGYGQSSRGCRASVHKRKDRLNIR
jgi:hypothetical protein